MFRVGTFTEGIEAGGGVSRTASLIRKEHFMALSTFSQSSIRTGLLATSALVALAAMPSVANAKAYALAETTISNLTILDTNRTAFSLFNFSSQASASVTGGPSVNTTSGPPVGASYTQAAGPGTTAGINNCFAGGSTIGACVSTPGAFSNVGSTHPGPTQTAADLVPFGESSASYAFATSVVPATAVNLASGGTGGFLNQIAETNVSNATGVAQSGTSKQQWTFAANLTKGDVISINYIVAVDLQTDTSGANAVSALATSVVSYELDKCTTATSCVKQSVKNPNADNQSVTGTSTFNPGPVAVSSADNTACGTGTTAHNCNLVAASTGLFELLILVTDNVEATATPEPASLGLMGMGLLGLGAAIRRRSQKKAA